MVNAGRSGAHGSRRCKTKKEEVRYGRCGCQQAVASATTRNECVRWCNAAESKCEERFSANRSSGVQVVELFLFYAEPKIRKVARIESKCCVRTRGTAPTRRTAFFGASAQARVRVKIQNVQ